MIDQIIKRIAGLEKSTKRLENTIVFGTVTQASPLRVRLDGDTDELPYTPPSLVTPVMEDRVLILRQITSIIVVGIVGGGLWNSDWVTLTPTTGVFSNVQGSIRWQQIGKTVHLGIHIYIISKGTATGNISFPFPVTPYLYNVNFLEVLGIGREVAVTGWTFTVEANGTNCLLQVGGALADGQFLSASVTYEAA
jgi:hypothetical protein